ncbi:hypothetical protein [Neorhizobium sp. NCHU2750]|uniref:hypothetical protein n=1 Tax=Neorhizobium sp. NCHU2750 TaxID=1825976 RepID=UPI000E751565|nr:hypothetical protein NCHU2750_58720 [Neorhizobium sp. NCHU2750]
MDRFADTENALVARLRVLKASPDMSINLLDIHSPLEAAGFSNDEVTAVLNALEQDKIATVVPGGRLLILKELPEV